MEGRQPAIPNYFTRTSFAVDMELPACSRQKYTPELTLTPRSSSAFHSMTCGPRACCSPSTSVLTRRPFTSKISSVTRALLGSSYWILALRLYGLGRMTGGTSTVGSGGKVVPRSDGNSFGNSTYSIVVLLLIDHDDVISRTRLCASILAGMLKTNGCSGS